MKNKFEAVYKEYACFVDKQLRASFTVDDIKIAIAKLIKGKASYSDGTSISPEHVLWADNALVYALTDLFNLCI